MGSGLKKVRGSKLKVKAHGADQSRTSNQEPLSPVNFEHRTLNLEPLCVS